LQADTQDVPIRPRVIQALFSVDGQTMGMAVRAIAVVQSATLTLPPPASPADGSVDIAIPTDPHPPDLTDRIQHADSQSGGRLLWTFDSPHGGLEIPDAPVVTDIGSEPGQFLRQVIDGIGAREGKPGLYAYLAGLGVTIADEMPPEFWDLLGAIAAALPAGSGRPTIFILSEEPYIPWELALVDPPLAADSNAAPFLGAQACVGRWSLGQRRPKLPPPTEVTVDRLAVIAGVYDREGWTRLVDAEGEAAELAQRYGGAIVEARSADVLRCLAGDPEAALLHFALHGVYDPNSVTNGLVLVDGATLDPLQVRGQSLRGAPFVFLNACQVGSGSKLLGDYAGMAESFLYAGASGVVAPLWSIGDGPARALSTRFYERAFAGESPSTILRSERAGFRDAPGAQSATALAYIFYGHPSLRLVRP
ncbi:MAG TPA: CHAT domain-containing protein, partial [Tepidiformaceae bacterium]|nr:CHAT domain-containing protein [Tepidiformaceae bacterium]